MRMRLTGVGDPPASPAPLSILGGAKCTSAHLAWTAADGGGFPTHKYVLERRAKREGTAWEVVGDGYFHEFRDERLRPGVGYDYRVAAWNAIGRGPYATASAASAQREACDPLEYVGAMALAPLFSLLRSAVFLGQLLLSGIVLFLAALRLVDAGAGDADYHPVFRALWTLCRVVTDYVPFARDLLLLVDPALGRVEVPELRERRTPGESDHALVGTSPATLPPEMSAPARRASSLTRRRRPPPLTRSSSAGSLGDDRERPSDAACSQCGKPFITGYRTRHYCYVCAASFCKRCGVVKHSNMVTCPVGARCACARCAHGRALGPPRRGDGVAREHEAAGERERARRRLGDARGGAVDGEGDAARVAVHDERDDVACGERGAVRGRGRAADVEPPRAARAARRPRARVAAAGRAARRREEAQAVEGRLAVERGALGDERGRLQFEP